MFFFRPSPSWLSPGRNTVSYQLNELCRILHHLLFGSIKKEHGPIHSPNICPCTMATSRKQKTRKQAKNTKTKQTNKKPKPNKKPASSQWTSSSMRISSSLCANIEPCVHRARHRNQKHHNCKAPGKGAKNNQCVAETRGPPQPGSRRSQRDAHKTLSATISEIWARSPAPPAHNDSAK